MKKTVLVVILAMLLPLSIWAQSSGKIAGVVTDKNSGEPLPGVNVVIEGTTFGAATDEDGYYVILNVPVGQYELTASFIGYTTVSIKDLRVSASITTEANFQLETTQLELGEAIVIVAERPLVEKNVTQSVSLVTSEQIQTIPIRGMNSIAATQNSVVVQDGAVHIRGGRSDEVGYYLDGASTSSVVSRVQSIHIIQEAVEEFQVLTGGYSAEFGSANSGIIRTELKTGGEDYHVSMDFQTDKFADEGKEFLGTYSYRHHNFVTTFSGPLGTKKVRFFGAFENQYMGDSEMRFSEGWEFTHLADMNESNPAFDPNNLTYVDKISYPDGFTPDQEYSRNTFNGTLLFDYSPVRFRVGMVFQSSKNQITTMPFQQVLNDRKMYDTYNAALITAKLTHVLSPTTLYEARFSYFSRVSEREDDYFDTDWKKWLDSAAVYDETNGDVVYRSAYYPPYSYNLGGFTFAANGAPVSSTYYISKESYFGGGLDFTSQMGKHHEVKAGFDFKSYTVRRYSISAYVMSQLADDAINSFSDIPNSTLIRYLGNVYGYDFAGNEIDDRKVYDDGYYADGARKPVMAAFYFNDKIEFNDLVINAGIRFDYFDSDDYELKNPANPEVDAAASLIAIDEWVEKDPSLEISPRLGFSFPVSSKTVFYMQYGKYVQMPSMDNAYYGSMVWQDQLVTQSYYYSNPIGFGLDPVKTTSYEIGFRQQLSDIAAFDITGFYKNVKGQITVERQQTESGSVVDTYDRMVNGDFTTTKGMELKLRMKRTNRLMAQANYTLTKAEGTGSSELSARSAVYMGTTKPTLVNPLDYNRTHKGSIMLDYRFGMKEGGPVFNGFGANLLFTFSSGHPYTLAYFPPGGQTNAYNCGVDYMTDTRSRQALEPINSSSTPWISNFDLRLDKSFRVMDKFDAVVYLRVTNLFNTKNVLNVYEGTGSAEDDGILSREEYSEQWITKYGEDYVKLYEAINVTNGDAYWNYLGKQLWGTPRQIMLGIKLSY